jgi:hypothetical protein
MTYEEFEKHMAEKYPRYCGVHARFGGYAISPGWYEIIESLVGQIESYTKWKRNTRAYQLRVKRARNKGREAVLKFICNGKEPREYDEDRADNIMESESAVIPKVDWVHIEQIKEKFGGLRFYYYGGDDHISGMVRMAEIWAGRTCEKCGDKGERRSGGWIRTLCDVHEQEYQDRNKKMSDEYYA